MDPSRIWDERYARQDPAQAHSSYEPWLERWYPRLQAQIDRPLLDLGCGNGLDAAYLIQRGFRVVGAELSRAALLLARDDAPTAHLVRLDLHAPLPYRTDTFGVVVANLSLHYFPWDHTRHIVDRV